MISATNSLAISDATAQDILKNLPDSLSPKRKKVIKAACSLVGKVNYFLGGKSSAIGWDSEWGKLKTVSAKGSKTIGTNRPFGLDCSGFVTWSFINSGFSASAIGHGTQGQIAKCSRISWNQAQVGDLAFLSDLSHVGIIDGKDKSGNILVIHCSSGANNVVITTGGFGFKVKIRTSIIVLFFIIVAAFCKYAYRLSDVLLFDKFAVFVRVFIYIGLFCAWAVSINKRILHSQVRKTLVTVAIIMIFWLTVRELQKKLLRYAAEQKIMSGAIFITRNGKPMS